MRRISGLISLMAVVVVAAGCAPAAEPVGAEPVGAPQAEPVGQALSASAEESAGNYSPPESSFGAVTCTVTEDSDGVDVDLDNLPDNGASVTVANCEAEARDGTMNASYSIQDDLVEAAAASFPFNFTMQGHFDVTATQGQATGTIAVDRTTSGRQDADSIGGSDAGSVVASLERLDARWTSEESYDWDTDYTQTGAVFGDGLMSLSGIWDIEMKYEQGDNSARVYANSTVMSLGTGLSLSSACPTHVVGGTLAATYDASNDDEEYSATLRVTWTGCGQSSTTYEQSAGTPGS